MGSEVVEALQWMYETAALDDWANSSMFVRTAQLAAVQSALVTALQSVTTDDGNTLLKPPITWRLSTSIRIAGIGLASLGLLLTVLAAAVVIWHRQHAVFRSAAPLLILVSFVGLLHVFSGIIFLVLPPTSFSCSAFNWCVQLGFTLLLSPILAKAWRIWQIFGRRKLHVVKLSNRKLLIGILAFTVCDLVILASWYGRQSAGGRDNVAVRIDGRHSEPAAGDGLYRLLVQRTVGVLLRSRVRHQRSRTGGGGAARFQHATSEWSVQRK